MCSARVQSEASNTLRRYIMVACMDTAQDNEQSVQEAVGFQAAKSDSKEFETNIEPRVQDMQDHMHDP